MQISPSVPASFCLPPHHYHSLENCRTFQDLALKFPGLSRTKPIFQDFPGPGNCTQKNPGLSRSVGTLSYCNISKHYSQTGSMLTDQVLFSALPTHDATELAKTHSTDLQTSPAPTDSWSTFFYLLRNQTSVHNVHQHTRSYA